MLLHVEIERRGHETVAFDVAVSTGFELLDTYEAPDMIIRFTMRKIVPKGLRQVR